MQKKDTLRIGELAELFGISVDSIRYYEKVGLLTPTRNQKNSYRVYSLNDVERIVMIRELLDLGFSTEQIKTFVSHRDVNATTSIMKDELQVINESILNLYETKNRIQSRLSAMEKVQNAPNFNKILLIEKPKRNCIMITDDNLPDNYVDYYIMKYTKETNHKINTIGACDCYTLDIHGSNPDSDYYRTKNVFFISEGFDSTSDYTLPAGKYLSLFYHGSLKNTKQFVPLLFDYAKKHNLTVIGDPIEMCHVDSYETDDESEYITELELPVTST